MYACGRSTPPSAPITAVLGMPCARGGRGAVRINCVRFRLRAFLSGRRGANHGPDEEICCRGDRHVLAHVCRVRLSGHRGRISASRDRIAGRLARFRPHRPHDGLLDRPYLRVPPEPGRDGRPHGRRPLPGRPSRALRYRSSGWRHRGRGRALRHCQRRTRLRSRQGLCVERLRRALAGPIRPRPGRCGGIRAHRHVPVHHHGVNARQGAGRVCPDCDRARPHADPPRRHSGHQPVRQPRAQHGSGRSSSAAGRWRNSGCSGSPRSWVARSAASCIAG